MMRRPLTVLTVLVAGLVLSGCVSGQAAPAEQSTTISQPALVDFRSYPHVRVTQNVTYRRIDDTAIRLNSCEPRQVSASPRAAIVVIHGGSWRGGDKSNPYWSSVCQWLAAAGYVVFNLDYRLAPAYPFPDGFSDVRASVRWIREHAKKYGVDPGRIGAFGGSAGGNLASMLGTWGAGDTHSGSRVAAVAELSGPADLTASGAELENFLPLQLAYLNCRTEKACDVARTASPLFHVDATDPPFFVAHSIDERIPLSQSTAFVRELRAEGVDTTFVTVRGTLHSIAMLGPDLRTRVIAFFDATLASR